MFVYMFIIATVVYGVEKPCTKHEDCPEGYCYDKGMYINKKFDGEHVCSPVASDCCFENDNDPWDQFPSKCPPKSGCKANAPKTRNKEPVIECSEAKMLACKMNLCKNGEDAVQKKCELQCDGVCSKKKKSNLKVAAVQSPVDKLNIYLVWALISTFALAGYCIYNWSSTKSDEYVALMGEEA